MNQHVLFVEDDADDVFLIERAWKKAGLDNHATNFASNGKEAIEYLSQSASTTSRPQVIFLDLNMPLMGGLEFLSWLRSQPHLETIPVVVLTTSANPADISAAYNNGTNAYVIKPSAIADFSALFRSAADFWLGFNKLTPVLR
jgi:CheY-like chemotaxis protein